MSKGEVLVRRLRRAVSVGRKVGEPDSNLALLDEVANFIEGPRVRLGKNQIDALHALRVEGPWSMNARWGWGHPAMMAKLMKSLVFHGLVRWEPPGGVSLGMGRYTITRRGRRVFAEKMEERDGR